MFFEDLLLHKTSGMYIKWRLYRYDSQILTIVMILVTSFLIQSELFYIQILVVSSAFKNSCKKVHVNMGPQVLSFQVKTLLTCWNLTYNTIGYAPDGTSYCTKYCLICHGPWWPSIARFCSYMLAVTGAICYIFLALSAQMGCCSLELN